MPRPFLDAVSRGDGRAPLVARFDDDADEPAIHSLTRAEAEAFQRTHPTLSPWRVVGAQVVLGVLVAAAAGLVAGRIGAISALYGAAVVFVPGALMARGTTSRLSSLSPAISAASVLWWSFIKIGVSVAMLVLRCAHRPGGRLAGAAGRDGAVHAVVLVRVALARSRRGRGPGPIILRRLKRWPQKNTLSRPVNTSFTT